MRIILVGLIIIVLCSFAGCSGGQGGTPAQDTQAIFTGLENSKDEPSSPRAGDIAAPEFHPPEVGPDTSDMKEIALWSSILGEQLADITGALTWYKSDKGEWPDDWDDIINGYLLFLPANPLTNEAVPLLILDELQGSVEAGAIVADPHPDGWELYQAAVDTDGSYYARKVFDREKGNSLVEKGRMYPPDARMENLMLFIRAWTGGRIQGFLLHTANDEGAPRMPESYVELTQGLIRNPSATLGYTPGEDGTGTFKVGVKPEALQWAFVFNKVKEIFEIRQLEVDARGFVIGIERLKPGDPGYDQEGFTWIISHEDFIE